MRYIPLLETSPCETWLQKAAKATGEIEAETDPAKRLLLIERYRSVWTDLKDWLLALSHQKCWFSEAKDCFQDWDVEHFRPKAEARSDEGTVREGYWWLSFAWENLRACGRVGNNRKGCYFPLGSAYSATSANRDITEEVPVLLDPVVKADCTLLSFNQLGEGVAAPGVDEWSERRVETSVRRYKLNFEKLVLMRKMVWETCDALVAEIQNLMQEQAKSPGAAKRALIEEKMRNLSNLASPTSVCSSAAIAYLQKSEIGWAMRLSAEAA